MLISAEERRIAYVNGAPRLAPVIAYKWRACLVGACKIAAVHSDGNVMRGSLCPVCESLCVFNLEGGQCTVAILHIKANKATDLDEWQNAALHPIGYRALGHRVARPDSVAVDVACSAQCRCRFRFHEVTLRLEFQRFCAVLRERLPVPWAPGWFLECPASSTMASRKS